MQHILTILKAVFATIGAVYLVVSFILGSWVLLDLALANFGSNRVTTVTTLSGK